MRPKIHIVSFDVPYPADYGGVIDVYYRCKALQGFGYDVYLHCFDYGRGRSENLEKLCAQVFYYARKSTLLSLFNSEPMIVASRRNKSLLENLIKDDAPIIFEGQHCTAYLKHPYLKNRVKLVRCHNIESDYYEQLAEVERSLLKRLFFKSEARKLSKQEKDFKNASQLFSVSADDQDYFVNKYEHSEFLAVANPLSKGDYIEKKDNYFLMHGNLSVMENEYAIQWVIKNVLPLTNKRMLVAGKSPSEQFRKTLLNHPQIELFVSPSDEHLEQLITQAFANLLITFQATGIKHKLINALSNGGHVIANNEMLKGTKMEEFCSIANSPKEINAAINNCFNNTIDLEEIQKRRSYLSAHYGLEAHARQIDACIRDKKKK